MEPPKDKLKADLALLERAIATLEVVLKEPFTEIVRDASIQRFEYCFELAWKTLQVSGDYMGHVCNSPREAIRYGFKMGWIKSPDDWFEAMEARNRTSHVYNPVIAQEVYEIAKKFPSLIHEIIHQISKV